MQLQPAPGQIPPGHRVYAIGDIHGCAAQLAALHDAIATDLAARPIAAPLLLHIGDYVDRGPDSRGALRLAAAGIAGLPTVNLMGNHERTMLDALGGEGASATDWLYAGGAETLRSFGADPDGPRAAWPAHFPGAVLDFLHGLALSHRLGDYLFVHAGIRPGVTLDAQAPEDLLRIRQPFLFSEADFGAIVVHGHTPTKTPVIRRNRIGIDTGAVFGGPLTCLVVEGDTLGFLTTEPPS